jgi:hypothetical protein
LSVPERRWARTVPAVAEPLPATQGAGVLASRDNIG